MCINLWFRDSTFENVPYQNNTKNGKNTLHLNASPLFFKITKKKNLNIKEWENICNMAIYCIPSISNVYKVGSMPDRVVHACNSNHQGSRWRRISFKTSQNNLEPPRLRIKIQKDNRSKDVTYTRMWVQSWVLNK